MFKQQEQSSSSSCSSLSSQQQQSLDQQPPNLSSVNKSSSSSSPSSLPLPLLLSSSSRHPTNQASPTKTNTKVYSNFTNPKLNLNSNVDFKYMHLTPQHQQQQYKLYQLPLSQLFPNLNPQNMQPIYTTNSKNKQLLCSSSQLSSSSSLASLQVVGNLVYLSIHETRLRQLPNLSPMLCLQSLYLNRNQIETIQNLWDMYLPNLKILALSYNNIINMRVIRKLWMPRLQNIQLGMRYILQICVDQNLCEEWDWLGEVKMKNLSVWIRKVGSTDRGEQEIQSRIDKIRQIRMQIQIQRQNRMGRQRDRQRQRQRKSQRSIQRQKYKYKNMPESDDGIIDDAWKQQLDIICNQIKKVGKNMEIIEKNRRINAKLKPYKTQK